MWMSEVYNFRLVYDWYKANIPWRVEGLDPINMERSFVVSWIGNLPVPPEIMPRLMWEPYLT